MAVTEMGRWFINIRRHGRIYPRFYKVQGDLTLCLCTSNLVSKTSRCREVSFIRTLGLISHTYRSRIRIRFAVPSTFSA